MSADLEATMRAMSWRPDPEQLAVVYVNDALTVAEAAVAEAIERGRWLGVKQAIETVDYWDRNDHDPSNTIYLHTALFDLERAMRPTKEMEKR